MKKEAMLYKKLENKNVYCYLCAHRCKIAESKFGICGVRQNIDGKLYSLVYGETISANTDPIEKKPLYHFLPGTYAYSIATIGCNFKCDFCQNWRISQIDKKKLKTFDGTELFPGQIVSNAKKTNCKSIAYTYTEPTIFFEYAYDTAKLAKENGLYNIFVTNGFMTPEAIEIIAPFLDAANIDLKFFKESSYNKIVKGRLQPILDSIKLMKKKKIWIEITTLIIPELNDSDEELQNIAQFISSVGKDIPWHISRFYPDYNRENSYPTPLKTLRKAKQIGKNAGLKYIYIGNVGPEDINTYCNNCKTLLIKRSYFGIIENKITENKCPKCHTQIEGVWN